MKIKRLFFYLICTFPTVLWAQVNFIDNTVIHKERTEINSKASDFGPSFVEDELWYSAFSKEDLSKIDHEDTKGIFYKLYKAAIDHVGQLNGTGQPALNELFTSYHAGPVSYCKATEELFVTVSNTEDAEIKNIVFQKKNIPLKILMLERTNGKWSDPKELPFNNSSYSTGHPAISPTGDTLIFSSDTPDMGIGETDLYMSIRKNGKWGEMINLGSHLNSRGKDMFPYFHKGKILFFASENRSGGKGKFDIWYSVLTESGFSTPINFSALNTSADDFGLIVHHLEEVGYLVTNANTNNGNDDIYKVLFDGSYELELVVRDLTSMEPMPGIDIKFNDDINSITNNQGVVNRPLNKRTEYIAKSDLEGYMNQSIVFSTHNMPYGKIKQELLLQKAEVGQKFTLGNIYYLFDRWEILPESEHELDKLVSILKDNPSWKVELGSHTDCRGTDAYNDVLSSKRSDSAVRYILDKGIESSRIIAKGYGESQILNHCMDGITCSEEQHRLNRRTEFTILKME